MKVPYRDCPSFERCSNNHCPLDPLADQRPSMADDPETRCTCRRSTREAIAQRYGLQGGGLTRRDKGRDARTARWEALPVEEKERRTRHLKLHARGIKPQRDGLL